VPKHDLAPPAKTQESFPPFGAANMEVKPPSSMVEDPSLPKV